MSTLNHDAYADGYDAYLAGKSETANPHDPQSDAHLDWNDGWNAAAEENDEANGEPK